LIGWGLRNWDLKSRLLASFLAILVAFSAPLHAQTSDEDRGYLAGLLESSLGGEGREVTIRGFKGALSSEATIDEIEIADFDGTWLRISNATLIWSRAALLSGRIDVDTLAAEKIELFRLPNAEESGLPGCRGHAVSACPNYPVSIEIGSLTAR
jgi:translocation and assembly module TamB